ncbi:probable transmembrane protein [Robiginitalea biformata HTCC2501]|uniref:Probable transmembrane protein n=1 Tax=Robiginitalea biformata (strain ATCC BAA-864 / DSM 15991 / KCTC 12146 / HTCC2501) TaxID=313596 RepID=A4CGT3_ROBBH|nr:probable transmembrane protein [Robiginitalea biformata HTCC2501]
MQYTFGLVPIVAGLDKFTNILTDWSQYVSAGLLDLIPVEAGVFMSVVGIVEIAAGALVLLRPMIGGIVVAAWLVLIALSLLLTWSFVDVAVRDLVMAVGAFSLVTLSRK